MSLALSSNPKSAKDGVILLKQRLKEYFELGKPCIFPDYILSLLLYIVRINPELKGLVEEVKYLLDTNAENKSYEFRPLLDP